MPANTDDSAEYTTDYTVNYGADHPEKVQYTHPPGLLVSDHYVMPYGYTCYRPFGTKDWLIMYTLSGKGIVNAGTEKLSCTAGFITVIPPGTPQDFYTAEGQIWDKLWAHFIPRVSWLDWLPVENASSHICNFQIKDPAIRGLIESGFNRLLRYGRDTLLRHREELILNALEEIVLLLSGQLSDQKKLDPRIKEVLTILAQHYDQEHQIEHLAQQVCLSPSRMSHLFKEQVGDSIIETLTKFRLKQAEKLLLYTTRRITDIAMEVGFNSPDYFTRQFSLYYGVSPSDFRKHGPREGIPGE